MLVRPLFGRLFDRIWTMENSVFGLLYRLFNSRDHRAIESTPKAPVCSVLFVCHGNICRSPMAVGIFRQLLIRHELLRMINVDSAGTRVQSIGKHPDWRAQACAKKRGVNISGILARPFNQQDFELFDRIIVMDRSNLLDVVRISRHETDRKKVTLLLEYAPETTLVEIPDPYRKGTKHFIEAYDLIEKGCIGLLRDIINGRPGYRAWTRTAEGYLHESAR